MAVGRLLRTLRPLKPIQIWARAAHLANVTRPDLRPPPPLRPLTGGWTVPVLRAARMRGPYQFEFLNEAGAISRPADWQTGRELLWLYNLHYFDDLLSADTARNRDWRTALIARWLTENPPGHGVGWAPYPTSLRTVNWIKAALGGFPLSPEALSSLAVQTRWLRDRLEHHLLGNHLLANAKALAFAGLFFEGPEAETWLAHGLHILADQLPEQILRDGGHFERSPMYHAIILEDLLDLLNLALAYGRAGDGALATLPDRIAAMRTWLAAMTHPDGRISFFNDATFGVAAEPEQLEMYAAKLRLPHVHPPREPVTELSESGYVRLQSGEAVTLLDVAPVGPDYLPGHAHADTLSFELSVGLRRVIVNSGTSVYGSGPQRQYERSTAAHSTVEIDGENSSEVWAGFRVGRRAKVRDVEIHGCVDSLTVSAGHDGYRWRPGRPVHRRTWELRPRSLVVRDHLDGRAETAVARFHFGVETVATAVDELSGHIDLGGRRAAWRTSSAAHIVADEWSCEFGRRQATEQLVAPLSAGALKTRVEW